MGSFDAVCGLSNMAIGYNDPVVAMVIRKNPFNSRPNSPIYPFDAWEPASFLVRGKYNDYGNVDINEAAQADWALTQKAAQAWWDTGYDIEIGPDGIEKREQRMKQSKLAYTFDSSGKRPDIRDEEHVFSLWMAHERVYDRLISEVKYEFYYHGDIKGATIKEAIAKRKLDGLAVMAGETPGKYADLHDKLGDGFKHALRYTINPWKAPSDSIGNPVSDYFENKIWDAFDKGDRNLVNKLVDHWGDHTGIGDLLREMRRALMPPGNIGPQHGHDQPHLVLADVVKEQAEINSKKYEEYDDEDDD